jgi:hypothetical protein
LIPLEAVTNADKSFDFFIEPLHLGQVFKVDIDNYFGLDCIKRFHKPKEKRRHNPAPAKYAKKRGLCE